MGCRKTCGKIIGFIIFLLVGTGLISQPDPMPWSALDATSTPTVALSTAAPTPIPTAFSTTASPTVATGNTRPEPGSVCAYDPAIAALLAELPPESWLNWIELLSGEKPVQMNGETYTIQTRFTYNLFNGDPDARAFEFVVDQLRLWGYEDHVTLFEETYPPATSSSREPTWKNLVAVIPGSDPELSSEKIVMTAHLDSITYSAPEMRAPGADDNGTGVATLLEAARLFKDMSFQRTIKLVFFTGEELGLWGSEAYVAQHADELDAIVGVFNLDMFGYDGDNDHCFEIHAGLMPASNLIGGCLADTIETYAMGVSFDYLTDQAMGSSDHVSFWEAGVGAIEILENYDTHNIPGGCGESDFNPNYHTEADRVAGLNLETGHPIAQATIMAAAKLAGPME